MSIGIPIKLLHEAEGHLVTVETKNGEMYRGYLLDSEDNMNCQLTNVTVTQRDGQQIVMENAFLRGSKIRYFILPDMLKNAPMFKLLDTQAAATKGSGRGYGTLTRTGRGRGAGFGVGRGRGRARSAT
jgi:small nuclear ribonucleoprotein D3